MGSGFGKERSWSRRKQLGFRKTVLTVHIEYLKGIVLKEGKSFLYPKSSIRNELLLEKKYLSMKDVFLGENHIPDNVPCLDTVDGNTSTYEYILYLRKYTFVLKKKNPIQGKHDRV